VAVEYGAFLQYIHYKAARKKPAVRSQLEHVAVETPKIPLSAHDKQAFPFV
jgi:hypothetical protein